MENRSRRTDLQRSDQLAGIEILRFLCAFGVLIWHYQHFFFLGGWDPAISQTLRQSQPLYKTLSFFYDNGSLAVPFFWVISGFIFYWHYAFAVRNRTVDFYNFVLRRFSRLYPLHFATLLIVAVGQYVYYASHKTTFIYLWNKPIWFASQLLFASNWFAREPATFNGPIWSVSIEILIYFSFFFTARAFRSGMLAPACASAVFSICFIHLHTFINPQVFACGMYFFAGGVAQRLTARPHALLVASFGTIALLAVLKLGLWTDNSASILLLAMTSVVAFTRLGDTFLGVLFRRLAFLGNATYSSYLLHFPLQLFTVIVVDSVGWDRKIFYSPIMLVGFIVLVIGLSLVVHRYFEMPMQELIRAGTRSSLGTSSAAVAEQ